MIRNDSHGCSEQRLLEQSPAQPENTVIRIDGSDDEQRFPRVPVAVMAPRTRNQDFHRLEFAQQRSCCISGVAILASCASLVFSLAACYISSDLARLLNVTNSH